MATLTRGVGNDAVWSREDNVLLTVTPAGCRLARIPKANESELPVKPRNAEMAKGDETPSQKGSCQGTVLTSHRLVARRTAGEEEVPKGVVECQSNGTW